MFHAHVHLIARRAGDVGNPRGGARSDTGEGRPISWPCLEGLYHWGICSVLPRRASASGALQHTVPRRGLGEAISGPNKLLPWCRGDRARTRRGVVFNDPDRFDLELDLSGMLRGEIRARVQTGINAVLRRRHYG